MKIHIARNGQKFGPFTQEQAATLMQNGEFSRFDFAWREGLPDWVHLELVLPPPTIKTAPPPEPQFHRTPSVTTMRSSAAGNFTDAQILKIASRQKAINWLLLAGLVLLFIPHTDLLKALVGFLSLIFIFLLAMALRSSFSWLYALVGFIPLFGLFSLLLINSRATKILKSHGVRVGLLGANDADLDAFRA